MTHSLKNFLKLIAPKYQKLILDYPLELKPRFGYGKPPHHLLYEIINGHRELYVEILNEIISHKDVFHAIKKSSDEKDDNQPSWNNGFLPGLDIVGLYTLLNRFKPKRYFEIGSGNSTKVARKSIDDNKLNTHIVSIDPFPKSQH